MRLPRKTLYALLLFLLGLNLVVRYPRTPHELGFDGFVYHGMTASLIQNGHAEWVLTPFSYFGLYPLSHPSGSFFFLADLAQLAGTPVEAAILLFDMSLVALGLLSAFLLSMEIRRDEGLALLVAALFSLSPRFVSGLLWEIPTRTLFSALVPLLIWLLLRLHRTRDKRSLGFGDDVCPSSYRPNGRCVYRIYPHGNRNRGSPNPSDSVRISRSEIAIPSDSQHRGPDWVLRSVDFSHHDRWNPYEL